MIRVKKDRSLHKVYRGTLDLKDRLFFASEEIGDQLVLTKPFILHTALYYALDICPTRYVDLGREKHYVEDTEEIKDKFYLTPAAPITSVRFETATYNAMNDEYIKPKQQRRDKNIPKFGRERHISPQTKFLFYILDYHSSLSKSDFKTNIRLGKKKAKAKLDIEEREGKIKEGEYSVNHPFGLYDYDKIPEAEVEYIDMRPMPLIKRANFTGKYIEIEDDDKKLPYKLIFFKRKRK